MSHSSKLFEQHKVQIKNKSGFDLAHSNFLTQKCGTLTPVCTVPMLPGDSISLGFMSQIKLPPMATSFYGRVDYRLEAFFVPYRILWGGWENFYTQPIADPYGSMVERPHSLPNLVGSFVPDLLNTMFGRGSLADYLGLKGYKIASSPTIAQVALNNILPFLAYHKIYDDWYRNANIQKPVFVRHNSYDEKTALSGCPYISTTITAGNISTGGIPDVDMNVDVTDTNTPLTSIGFC